MSIVRSQNRVFQDKPKFSILLVEDQRSLSQMAASMLQERWNCDVHIAASLQEARTELASDTHFFLAVSDLHLPDATNGEVIDVLNEARLPTIAITGYFDKELRTLTLKKGVLDYVTKDSLNAYDYITELVGRLYKNQFIQVLAVDDSATTRAYLKNMLSTQFFQVLTASNGVEALTAIEANPGIRLILTDYNMPEMDGFKLISEIRKKHGKDRIAIIGLSASDDSDLTARFLKIGANDFLSKPFSFEELTWRVNQNIEMLEHIDIIRDVANRDFLTGLFNRRYFFENGAKIFATAQVEKNPLVVAMMDIDYFKKINDTYGHDCGDSVLKNMAILLSSHFKNYLVARLGGEEFAVLATGNSFAEIAEHFETFHQSVADTPVQCEDKSISFTISIGLCPLLLNSLDAMLKQADSNLYLAKQSGRNMIIMG